MADTDRDRMVEIALDAQPGERHDVVETAIRGAVDRLIAAGYTTRVVRDDSVPKLGEPEVMVEVPDDAKPYGDSSERTPVGTTDWEGVDDRECGDHRTTGRRAWCFDCTEWCYQSIPCRGCELPALRAERDLLSWLYAEKVWQLEQERESRFRWAEEAAHMQQVGMRLLPGGPMVDLDRPIRPTACACVTAEQVAALTPAFTPPVCAVHPKEVDGNG